MLIEKYLLSREGMYGAIDWPISEIIKHEKLAAAARAIQEISSIVPRYYMDFNLYHNLTKDVRPFYRELICL